MMNDNQIDKVNNDFIQIDYTVDCSKEMSNELIHLKQFPFKEMSTDFS